MQIILLLLCISGIAHFVSQSDGPFSLVGKARRLAIRIPLIGPQVFLLLECPFCIGMHAGWITYLIYAPRLTWGLWEGIVFSFAGGMSNLLVESLLFKILSKGK